uniref:SPK domain-containing protein n=1 Tax=Caenorhabditis tropicalis TaxID=1561998 RepID=A0A1I7SZA6_9PELO
MSIHDLPTTPSYLEMLYFVAGKASDDYKPMTIKELTKELIRNSFYNTSYASASRKMERLVNKIAMAPNIDIETKVKVMFVLDCPVEKKFLHELKAHGSVTLNDSNRIIRYIGNNGGFKLGETNQQADSEHDAGFKFISEKCESATSPLILATLCKELMEKSQSATGFHTWKTRVRAYRQSIQDLDNLDANTKIKRLFALSVPVDSDFLEILRERATVEVDGQNRITKYTANDGSLKLEGIHSVDRRSHSIRKSIENTLNSIEQKSETKATGSDNKSDDVANVYERQMAKLIKFATEQCENAKSPLVLAKLFKDFKRTGCSVKAKVLESRLWRYRQTIHKMKNSETKVKQLFGLSVPLNEELLNELRETATVEVDSKGRIIKYASNDLRLILQGNHGKGGPKPAENDESSGNDCKSTTSGSAISHRKPSVKSECGSDDSDHTSEAVSKTATNKYRHWKSQTARMQCGQPPYRDLREKSLMNKKRSSIISTIKIEPMEEEEDEEESDTEAINKSENIVSDVSNISIDSLIPEPVEYKKYLKQLVPVDEHIRFLESIINLVTTLDFPALRNMEEFIDEKIIKLKIYGNEDEEVTYSELRASISTCLLIIQKNSMKEFEGESTSVKDFLLILRTSLIGLQIPILDDSQQFIKQWITSSSAPNERVPIEKIESSLQAILDLIAP